MSLYVFMVGHYGTISGSIKSTQHGPEVDKFVNEMKVNTVMTNPLPRSPSPSPQKFQFKSEKSPSIANVQQEHGWGRGGSGRVGGWVKGRGCR